MVWPNIMRVGIAVVLLLLPVGCLPKLRENPETVPDGSGGNGGSDSISTSQGGMGMGGSGGGDAGSGGSMPISTDQLRDALGSDQAQQMAGAAGQPVEDLLKDMSEHLSNNGAAAPTDS